MLTKSQKEQIIQEIKEKLSNSKVVITADFRGLSVKEMDELKKEIREIGGSVQVIKKTLMNIALKEQNTDFDLKKFTGPLVFVFGPEETGVPKKIWNFIKKSENLKIQGGLLEKEKIDAAQIEALAKMPSREELLAKLVGTIQAPVSGFVYALSGTIGSLVNVLKAVSDKKEE